jgi:hypothetical protein
MGFRWNQNPEPPSELTASASRQRPAEQGLGLVSGTAPPSATAGPQNVAANSSIAFSPGRLFNLLAFEAESGLPPPPPPPPLPAVSLAFPSVVQRGSSYHAEGPPASSRVRHQGLIPPNTAFARAVVMGNATPTTNHQNTAGHVVSNLAAQMNQTSESQPIPPRSALVHPASSPRHQHHTGTSDGGSNDSTNIVDEADSASGPSPSLLSQSLQATGGAIGRKPHTTSTTSRQTPPPLVPYGRPPLFVEPPAADVSPISTADAQQPFRRGRRYVVPRR